MRDLDLGAESSTLETREQTSQSDERNNYNDTPAAARKIVVSDQMDVYFRYEPSVTFNVFVCWILPVLIIAFLTRFTVDRDATFLDARKTAQSHPITIDISQQQQQKRQHQGPSTQPTTTPTNSFVPTTAKRPKKKEAPIPTLIADKPTLYIETVQAIKRRRLDWETVDANPMEGYVRRDATNDADTASAASDTAAVHYDATATPKPPLPTSPPRGASSDPIRNQLKQTIDELRKNYQQDPTNSLALIELADALRMYDVQYHDGGTAQNEAIDSYQRAIQLVLEQKQVMIDQGLETNRNLHGTVDIPEELTLDYSARSVDGILCALYTSLGKVYFMANMFEKAIESYSTALQIEPLYLDAMSARGSSRIIVGDYVGAGQDFLTVMEHDVAGRFLDVYTGLARVLQAKESAVPEGWDPMIDNVQRMIPALENQYNNPSTMPQSKHLISNTLNRLYHVLFLYHDVKTNDVDAAWQNLRNSYRHKMSVLPTWSAGMETQKIAATKQIFHQGFWPPNVGSPTTVPIFIIGFVRSGSTLLERVLDAHPQIVGTGENSIFNGRLDEIRNKIVETSLSGDANTLTNVIESLANGVVDEMKQRWQMVASVEERAAGETHPERYVDKMLTNYYNVGFIHMLFPNALILHVAREPMDTVFSAYKHEFPPGPLDYTSDFSSLAELYHSYRDLMEHWDKVLPGRVTHIRYEDLVYDMPGMARKIIEATGLEWDDSVLDFHKKKQAVNTLSTTQVRKGVYRDSLQAWRRYETHLAPLVKMIGERTKYELKTTLKGYQQPPIVDINDSRSLSELETDKTADTQGGHEEL